MTCDARNMKAISKANIWHCPKQKNDFSTKTIFYMYLYTARTKKIQIP